MHWIYALDLIISLSRISHGFFKNKYRNTFMLHHVTEKMQKIHLLSTRRSSLGDIRPLIPHILGEPNEEAKISTALVFFH